MYLVKERSTLSPFSAWWILLLSIAWTGYALYHGFRVWPFKWGTKILLEQNQWDLTMLYSLQGHIAEEDHALLLNSITFNIWLFVKICLCIRQCNHELFDYDQAGPRGQNPTDHTVVYFHHSHNGLWWEFPDIVLRLAKGMFIRKIFPTWKIHCGTSTESTSKIRTCLDAD